MIRLVGKSKGKLFVVVLESPVFEIFDNSVTVSLKESEKVHKVLGYYSDEQEEYYDSVSYKFYTDFELYVDGIRAE